jgi:hypothetical protein
MNFVMAEWEAWMIFLVVFVLALLATVDIERRLDRYIKRKSED